MKKKKKWKWFPPFAKKGPEIMAHATLELTLHAGNEPKCWL